MQQLYTIRYNVIHFIYLHDTFRQYGRFYGPNQNDNNDVKTN